MADDTKVAVVTGANRGLGAAIARGLAEQGLHVVLAGRNEYSVDRVVSELTKVGFAASGHQLDVNDPASWRAPSPTPPSDTAGWTCW